MCADTEPRVVIDSRQHLGPSAVGEQEPTDDVHLPQLHRRAAFPPFPLAITRPPRARVDQVQPDQRPIGPRLRHREPSPLGQLKTQPPRTPRRMRQPQLHQRDLNRRRHLMRTRTRTMRTVPKTSQPAGLVLGQPRMHGLTRHPEPGRHARHCLAVGDHRPHGLIPLLSHRQLPHERECHQSTEVAVTHQPKHCHQSTEGRMASISRSNTGAWWAPSGSNRRPTD